MKQSRTELIEKAKTLGIQKPQSIKTLVLEQMIGEMEGTTVTKTKGRPVNPESTRQKRLMEIEAKRTAGLLKKGRPVNATSARQKRLMDIEMRRAAGTLKKGRPAKVKTESQEA
jgi:hypothetical protein